MCNDWKDTIDGNADSDDVAKGIFSEMGMVVEVVGDGKVLVSWMPIEYLG